MQNAVPTATPGETGMPLRISDENVPPLEDVYKCLCPHAILQGLGRQRFSAAGDGSDGTAMRRQVNGTITNRVIDLGTCCCPRLIARRHAVSPCAATIQRLLDCPIPTIVMSFGPAKSTAASQAVELSTHAVLFAGSNCR